MVLRKNVVFLGRDGTINCDAAGYIKSGSGFKFLKHAAGLVYQAQKTRYRSVATAIDLHVFST